MQKLGHQVGLCCYIDTISARKLFLSLKVSQDGCQESCYHHPENMAVLGEQEFYFLEFYFYFQGACLGQISDGNSGFHLEGLKFATGKRSA